jgi:hypothetical protein
VYFKVIILPGIVVPMSRTVFKSNGKHFTGVDRQFGLETFRGPVHLDILCMRPVASVVRVPGMQIYCIGSAVVQQAFIEDSGGIALLESIGNYNDAILRIIVIQE